MSDNPQEVAESPTASDYGPQFGLHARFRTEHGPDDPPWLIADPALTFKKGHRLGVFAGVDVV